MPLTIALPRPLDEEVALEARREGVPATDHATLLLYLAIALLADEAPTPFQEAVRGFLSSHSLDADRVSSVFEELVRLCLKAQDETLASGLIRKVPAEPAMTHKNSHPESTLVPRLKAWRNAAVHRRLTATQPVDSGHEAAIPHRQPAATPQPQPGTTRKGRPSAFGKYAGIIPSSEEYMREKQKEIAREEGREA